MSYEWEIQNQSDLSEKKSSTLYSPIFSGSPDEITHLWSISIQWDSQNPDYYGVFINLKDERLKKGISMDITLEVIENTGKIIANNNFTKIFECRQGWGNNTLIDRSKYKIANISKIKASLILRRPAESKVENINPKYEKMLKDFLKLYECQDFSDITIFCKNREFKVHKQILAARSPVFNKMFSNNMKEKNTNEVHIENVTAEAMEITIKFMYSGYAEIPYDQLEEVLDLAEQYDLQDLKQFCEVKIEHNLDIEKSVKLLIMAYKYNLPEPTRKILIFIKRNLEDVNKTEDYLKELPKNPNLMMKIIDFISKYIN